MCRFRSVGSQVLAAPRRETVALPAHHLVQLPWASWWRRERLAHPVGLVRHRPGKAPGRVQMCDLGSTPASSLTAWGWRVGVLRASYKFVFSVAQSVKWG